MRIRSYSQILIASRQRETAWRPASGCSFARRRAALWAGISALGPSGLLGQGWFGVQSALANERSARGLTPATQLGQAIDLAVQRKVVLLAFFSTPGCPYCKLVREQQLLPRLRPTEQPAVEIVEINLIGQLVLGVKAEPALTEKALARRLGIRVAPTVVALDRNLKPVGEALVGYSSSDFYSAYLEDRITFAFLALGQGKP